MSELAVPSKQYSTLLASSSSCAGVGVSQSQSDAADGVNRDDILQKALQRSGLPMGNDPPGDQEARKLAALTPTAASFMTTTLVDRASDGNPV